MRPPASDENGGLSSPQTEAVSFLPPVAELVGSRNRITGDMRIEVKGEDRGRHCGAGYALSSAHLRSILQRLICSTPFDNCSRDKEAKRI
jgi:hypothetical protein